MNVPIKKSVCQLEKDLWNLYEEKREERINYKSGRDLKNNVNMEVNI